MSALTAVDRVHVLCVSEVPSEPGSAGGRVWSGEARGEQSASSIRKHISLENSHTMRCFATRHQTNESYDSHSMRELARKNALIETRRRVPATSERVADVCMRR